MKRFFKSVARSAFQSMGLEIVKRGVARDGMDRLRLIGRLGFAPKDILDGGAFHGLWSKEVAEVFPGSRIVMVEPNPALQEIIRSNSGHIHPRPELAQIAIGREEGRAAFNIWRGEETDQGASLLPHVSGEAAKTLEVAVESLDHLAQRLDFFPNLVKLDLQGAELDALRGGEAVLQKTEVLIIEFGCLDAYIGRTTPREVMDHLYDRGFCLYDVTDLHDRPYDGALTGGDFTFVRKDSALRAHKGYD